MTSTMQQAAEIAQRLSETSPEVVEQRPKDHSIPLRYVYGNKKRKAKRLASQAKGLYRVEAIYRELEKGQPKSERLIPWHVLARNPKQALKMVMDLVAIMKKPNAGYYEFIWRETKRICGVTAGTKERIL